MCSRWVRHCRSPAVVAVVVEVRDGSVLENLVHLDSGCPSSVVVGLADSPGCIAAAEVPHILLLGCTVEGVVVHHSHHIAAAAVHRILLLLDCIVEAVGHLDSPDNGYRLVARDSRTCFLSISPLESGDG